MKRLLLVALASCSTEPREVLECPPCVCEQARACPECPDDSMAAYLEGVAHGEKSTLDSIVLDLCFDHAGEGPGWERSFDRCQRDFHKWEDRVRPKDKQ
jgi:hypothetical protein